MPRASGLGCCSARSDWSRWTVARGRSPWTACFLLNSEPSHFTGFGKHEGFPVHSAPDGAGGCGGKLIVETMVLSDYCSNSYRAEARPPMSDDQVQSNLKGMDDLDFDGWNNADWDGVFAHHHTDDVLVDWKGQAPTRGVQQHIDAMKAYVESAGGTPPQITAHPIAFGSGEWTCVVGEFEGGGRMVTVARWRDGAIAEEYIWS